AAADDIVVSEEGVEGVSDFLRQLTAESELVGRELVAVHTSERQFRAVVPNVSHIKHVAGGELVLEAQRPLIDIGSRSCGCRRENVDIVPDLGKFPPFKTHGLNEAIGER